MAEYVIKYTVSATSQARKQGLQSGLSRAALMRIIRQVKELKYWPHNEEAFTYEKVRGAYDFKFYEEGKWIRVFAYLDEERSTIWIIKVLVKKSNELRNVDLISLSTAVSSIEYDMHLYKKSVERMRKKSVLSVYKGGTT